MPRVCLTMEQKMEARNLKLRRKMADGLAKAKNRGHMSMDDIAKKVGIGREAVSKVLGCEDVKLSYSAFLRLLDLAGLMLKEGGEE